ncbi:recombinase family protein [uncultured Oscillibacter sp.]|uniref:recombinase family protein n=1 Tax=uncultured Oscillibacter sp. TaxID=876091 RepID=UPI00262270FF|nr:recombinase family protein [uncultured Oscillibacter sp.]
MAGNRKLPFGYRMEHGEIKEHPTEATAVREIFQRYRAGASYKVLVEYLSETGPVYDTDKPWNKNMVARILENARYTGEDRFPALISPEEFQKARKQREAKAVSSTKSPAQKELRRLCGGNPPKYIEAQVLGVLNRLAAAPETIQLPNVPQDDSAKIKELRQKLTALLEEVPANEDSAKKAAMDLAAERLNAIGSEEYEAERLRRLFDGRSALESLDMDLLRASVRRVSIRNRRAVVELKNGQVIETRQSVLHRNDCDGHRWTCCAPADW